MEYYFQVKKKNNCFTVKQYNIQPITFRYLFWMCIFGYNWITILIYYARKNNCILKEGIHILLKH